MKAFKKVFLVGAAMMAVLAFSTPARANAFIDFGTGTAGVSGVYTLLAGGHATGSNIPVGVVTVGGTVACPVSCVYDTAGTGPGNQLFPDSNGSAVLSFDTLNNWITVVGYIPALGINSSVTLLSGSFVSWQATSNGLGNAYGPDSKYTGLLTALGIPTNTPFAFFGFSLTAGAALPGTTNQWAVGSTDIRNDAVPEPGSMVLLGTGLLGLGALVRRRLRKS